ncbi:MAG: histidinol dehydrogenase [Clostridiales bacterium]|jgi:histidinol dehydrogenase|nr:histidinol dehydrogenase [Clostridiales bacterium]
MLQIKTSYEKRQTAGDYGEENSAVAEIIKNVRARGDAALFEYAKKFDNADLNKDNIRVTESEILRACETADPELLKTLLRVKTNVLGYHERQMKEKEGGFDGETGWKFVPVKRAGLYVPGGLAAYPSSVLMCALPAAAAGVGDITLVTPNVKNPLVLVAAKLCGVNKIYKIGGAHAIAALAYGTESVGRVDVIAGPGNIYVTLAKKAVFGDVGIDMLAGPSEICVLADDTASSEYVIADLLSQAEHGPLGESVLVTTSRRLAEDVASNIRVAAGTAARRGIIENALDGDNFRIILTENTSQALAVVNEIAPEHLEICAEDARELSKRVYNAGVIFIGRYTPVAVGDYFAGPSHVLPTGGNSRFSSVLSVDTFLKRISLVGYNKERLAEAAPDIVNAALAEGFDAHAQSVNVRLKE